MTDVAEIARGLSEAQRTFVISLDAEWRLARDLYPPAIPNVTARRDERLVEMLHGPRKKYRLTPLGLAVRTHLLSEKEQ